MKFVVFGASGQVGQQVVQLLLDKDYEVRAFIHGANPLPRHNNLVIVKGDVKNANNVSRALHGCDKVISTLGSWGTPNKDILSVGMMNIIPAMQKAGISRIVSLTGAAAKTSGDTPRIIDRVSRTILRVFAAKILRDGESHLQQLEASGLDWTVVRSPVMTDKLDGGFTLTTRSPLPWHTIPRQSVANAITDLAITDQRLRSAPFIHKA